MVFLVNAVFFFVVAFVYGTVTEWSEMVGFPALLLTGGLSGMIGVYLWLTDRRAGRQPQDNDDAEISDADADYAFFSPWSWWPTTRASAAAVAFYGSGVGWSSFPFRSLLGIRALVSLAYD